MTSQVVRDVDTIRADRTNTVKSLRDQLQEAVSAGYGDGGFPILRKEPGGLKMIGYIGVNELEHALSELSCIGSSGHVGIDIPLSYRRG